MPNTLGNLDLLTVLPDGKTVKLTVGCSVAAVTGCSGTVGIAPLGGARISAKPKKPVSYGSTKFTGIAPGAKKTITVKLNAKGKAALRKAGLLRVLITVAISDARKVTRTQSLTKKLKLPPKHG